MHNAHCCYRHLLFLLACNRIHTEYISGHRSVQYFRMRTKIIKDTNQLDRIMSRCRTLHQINEYLAKTWHWCDLISAPISPFHWSNPFKIGKKHNLQYGRRNRRRQWMRLPGVPCSQQPMKTKRLNVVSRAHTSMKKHNKKNKNKKNYGTKKSKVGRLYARRRDKIHVELSFSHCFTCHACLCCIPHTDYASPSGRTYVRTTFNAPRWWRCS